MKQLALIVVFIIIAAVFALDGDTFVASCAPLTVQRSDPIVNPGLPGGHVHAIIGGNAFKREMGPTDAVKANETTCIFAVDHSNYWVPALYHHRADGMWELVEHRGSNVYYQKRACDYSPTAKVCDKTVVPMAFPDGFRMVAGDPTRRTQNDSDVAQRAVHVMCLDANHQQAGFPPMKCQTMRWEVYFPSCWDGKNLDSADHKSHVAYPAIGNFNGGVCPESHPVALLSIFFEFFFTTGVYADSKFAFANGDATGYGFHGDFVMGWTNRTLLQNAHRDCINSANCPTLGNQGQIRRPLIYPAVYEEEVGLNGPIASLPGNNPVTWPNSDNIIGK